MMYCIQGWTLPTLLSLLAMVGSSAVSRWLGAILAYWDFYWLYANKRLRALKNEVRLDVLYILTHETMGPCVGIMDTQRKPIHPVYRVSIITSHFPKLSSRPCKKPNICPTRFRTILIPLSRWSYSSSDWSCVSSYLCSYSLLWQTPGYPSYENSTRTEGESIPKIPSLPISWNTASRLLQEIETDGKNRTIKLVNNGMLHDSRLGYFT